MVSEQLAEGAWRSTEELSALVASARMATARLTQIEHTSNTRGVPFNNSDPARAPPPAAEEITDSGTDLSDGHLETAFALALGPVDNRATENAPQELDSDALPSAYVAPLDELPIMDPRLQAAYAWPCSSQSNPATLPAPS